MIESLFEVFRCIGVAVAFDDHTQPLIDTAVALCRATGKDLYLVHVLEPWAQQRAPLPFGSPDPLWNATPKLYDDPRAQAQFRLNEIIGTLPKDVKARAEIFAGKASDVLPQEVLRLDTALLLVGARFSQTALMPNGVSTAAALMRACPVPVMVIDAKSSHLLPPRGGKFLVADDLTEHAEQAVRCAIDLAKATKAASLTHLHVTPLDPVALETALTNAAAASHAAGNLAAAARDVYAAISYHYEVELEKRSEPYLNQMIEGGVDYRKKVASGNLKSELTALVDRLNPDLLIFGHHASLHHDPFFFGRMPYKAMLAYRRPVLVVPTYGPKRGTP